MNYKKVLFCAGLGIGLMSLTQCENGTTPKSSQDRLSHTDEDFNTTAHSHNKPQKAFARIHSLKDGSQEIKGTVSFTRVEGGIRVVANISGLPPGKHGFHIHELASCEGDGSSAGGHFNPNKSAHGGPDDKVRHVGDLGNIEADENGNARYDRIDNVINLHGKHSILGRSIMIHSDPDDFKSQPAGNSGSRVACGIIEVGSP